jgi:hypothetical protein
MQQRRYPHQFRFQLIAEWLTETYIPLHAADVGGGKGLLAYLLNQKGWQVSVIDPVYQLLPPKYKDLENDQRVLLKDRNSVPRISQPFSEEMANDFDLLIGLHAHGSNIKIINAAKKYHKDFVLFPCCVIDEPIEIKPSINWFDSLEKYALDLELPVQRITLNFVRQSTGIYTKNPAF